MGGKFEIDGAFGSLSIYVSYGGEMSIEIDGRRSFDGRVEELATLLEQHTKFMDYIDGVK